MQLRSSIATHKRGWPSLTHASSPHRWRVFSTLYNAVFLASIWRKISIALIIAFAWHLSAMDFHEKAGRSQVDSSLASLNKVLFSRRVALSPCFHPHSRGAIRFARCMLGVLVTADAAICLAPCGSALSSGTRARPLTQSPKLGFGLLSFPSGNGFDFVFVLFYAAGDPPD
jgi:hypothetical protein